MKRPLDLLFILMPAIGALVGLGAIALLDRWWSGVLMRRLRNGIKRGKKMTALRARLMPESLSVVAITETDVRCTRPNGTFERVTWDDLQEVEILTTDDGPWNPDVFWVLHGSSSGCVIPQGATGEDRLIERLHQLPGFDNGAMITAMTTSAYSRTRCWSRPAA